MWYSGNQNRMPVRMEHHRPADPFGPFTEKVRDDMMSFKNAAFALVSVWSGRVHWWSLQIRGQSFVNNGSSTPQCATTSSPTSCINEKFPDFWNGP